MATDIKIVIEGDDQFSAAFMALDNAMARVGSSGEETSAKLAGMSDTFSQLAASTQDAGQAAASFTQDIGENFAGLIESQQAALEEVAFQQESFAVETGERLLEIDADFLGRGHNQRDQANSKERRQQSAHLQALRTDYLAAQRRVAQEESKILATRLQFYSGFFAAILELAESQGKSQTALVKTLGIAQALVDTYRAVNNALASVPYPFNLAAAAVVLTRGLANVQRIRQVGIAHGGLDFVPREQTFLLDRGERVLSASQNKDLTGFLAADAGPARPQGVVIENLTVHILENATSGGALLELEEEEMRQLVADRIVPAMDELARLGIQPEFAERKS